MSVVQIGSLSDFRLLIRVFLVLRCRCESAGMATRPFIIYNLLFYNNKYLIIFIIL